MQNNDLPGGEGGIRTPGVAQNGPNQPRHSQEAQGRRRAIWGRFRSEFRSNWRQLLGGTIIAAVIVATILVSTPPALRGPMWILPLALGGLALTCWAMYRYVKDVVPFEQGDSSPDFGIHQEPEEPVRNDGSGYEWKDGTITKDRQGKEQIK